MFPIFPLKSQAPFPIFLIYPKIPNPTFLHFLCSFKKIPKKTLATPPPKHSLCLSSHRRPNEADTYHSTTGDDTRECRRKVLRVCTAEVWSSASLP
ncbi:hypothetical protein HanXRQr2_Chr04g0145971 [Helianthus annuus]|nr:hypothetical protein HanXRQr2_Chr04g0145971 [Helianthus annuus]